MAYDTLEQSQRGGAPVELYRFTVGTLNTYTLTSADTDVVFTGETYVAEVVTRGEIAHSAEAASGHVNVELPRTSAVVNHFIAYSPEPPMGLTIYRKHRTDPESIVLFSGAVASVNFAASRVTLLCLPTAEALRRVVPRNRFQQQCNWDLYSGSCGVSKAGFATAAVVSSVSGLTVQATAFSSKANGWFNNGWLENVDGERRWVVSHVGSTITLNAPFIGLLVGDDLIGYAGCDRTEAVCLSKFNNIANHLGFARVPTKNPYNTGVA